MSTQEQTLPQFTPPSPDGDELFSRAVDEVISGKKKQKAFAPEIDERIERYSAKHDVDPDLVRPMMTQESGGHGNAVSPKGARSYMQLMPDTAKSLGVTDIDDPDQNIEAGIRYLRQQLDEFGTVPLALAAYNAGPGAVRKHGGIPPYAETQNYIKTITNGYTGTGRRSKTSASVNGDDLFSKAVDSIIEPARGTPSAPIAAAVGTNGNAAPSSTNRTPQSLPTFSAPETFDTKLSPDEASKFQQWKEKYAPNDTGEDYDLRGAFKAGLKPDAKSGHWPDTFKKPNHPTFSNESQYATGENALRAGHWEGDTFVPPSAMDNAEDLTKRWIEQKGAQADKAYSQSVAEAPARHAAKAKAVVDQQRAQQNAQHAQRVAQQNFSKFAKDRDIAADIQWHFGDEGLQKFHLLSEGEQKKMVTIALAAAQRDEAKRAAGIDLTQDPAYQARLRKRIPSLAAISLEDRPSGFTFGEHNKTAQELVGVRSDVSQMPDYNPRTGKVEIPDAPQWKPSKQSGMGDVHAAEASEVAQENAIRNQVIAERRAAATSGVIDPRREDDYFRKSGIERDVRQRMADRPTAKEQDLAKTEIDRLESENYFIRLWNQPTVDSFLHKATATLARDISKFVPGDPGNRLETLADKEQSEARIADLVQNYQYSGNKGALRRIGAESTRLAFTLGPQMLAASATGIPFPIVAAGSNYLENGDRPAKERLDKAGTAYVLALAYTKAPSAAVQGVGKLSPEIAKLAERYPEIASRTAGGLLFGTAGGVESALAGGSKEDVLVHSVAGAIPGVALGSGKRLAREAVKAAIESDVVPEPAKDFMGRVTDLGSGLVKSSDGRAASLYVDKETGEVFGNTLTADQVKNYDPSIVTGGKRNVRNVQNLEPDQYDALMQTLGIKTKAAVKGLPAPESGPGETPKAEATGPPKSPVAPAKASTTEVEKGAAKTAPSPAKAERRATPRVAGESLGWADRTAAQFDGEIERMAGGGYRVQMGSNVGEAKTERDAVEWVRQFADEMGAKAPKPKEPPVEPLIPKSGQLFHGGKSVVTELSDSPMYAVRGDREFAEGYSTGRHGAKTPQVTELSIDPSAKLATPAQLDIAIKSAGLWDRYRSGDEGLSQADMARKPAVRRILEEQGFDGVDDALDFGFKNEFDEVPVTVAFNAKKTFRLATIDDAAHEAATSPQNGLAEPSQPMKEAGNYKKGHISVAGMDMAIENPEGSKREGVDPNGKPWSITLKSHYGYIKRTNGADDEQIDSYVRPGTVEDYDGPIFVVNQLKGNGHFDEHKVMIGWKTEVEARKGYLENYEKGWDKFRDLIKFDNPEKFKQWLGEDNTKIAEPPVEPLVREGAPRREFPETMNQDRVSTRDDAWWQWMGIKKPKANTITVYRGVAEHKGTMADEIRHGDYVTLHRDQAANYGDGGKVLSKQVPVDDLIEASTNSPRSSELWYAPRSQASPQVETVSPKRDEATVRYAAARKAILAGNNVDDAILTEFPALQKLVKKAKKTAAGTVAPGTEVPVEELSRAELQKRADAGGAASGIYAKELQRREALTTLGQFVRKWGGIKSDVDEGNKGELARVGRKEAGTTGILNQNSKYTAEAMALRAAEEGYRGDWVEVTMAAHGPQYDVNGDKFLAALEDDLSGVTESYASSEMDFEDEYRDYLTNEMGEHLAEEFENSADAIISMLENDGAAQLLNDVYGGSADEAKIREFKKLAKGYGVDAEDVVAIIAAGRAQAERFQDAVESEKAGPADVSPEAQTELTADDWQQAKQDLGAGVNAVEMMYSESSELIDRILSGRYTDDDVEEFYRQAGAFGVSQEDTEAILDAGEEARGPQARTDESDLPKSGQSAKVSINGNHVRLENRAAVDLLNEAMRAVWDNQPPVTGLFLKPAQAGALSEAIRMIPDGRGVEMADAIQAAHNSHEAGTVRIGDAESELHEKFHEASEAGAIAKSLRSRHKDLTVLTKDDAWFAIYYNLVSKGYDRSHATLVEEAAAHLAEGRYVELGISRKQAIDWMTKWFQSFVDTNGRVSLAKFRELNNEAAEARDAVYAQSSAEQQTQRSLPDVSEARQSRNRQELGALARAREDEPRTLGFYSQLYRTIAQKMPDKASAADVRGLVTNAQSGVKADELKWTGFDDFLAGKEKVTRQEVMAFLRANSVKVEIVTLGNDTTALDSALHWQLAQKIVDGSGRLTSADGSYAGGSGLWRTYDGLDLKVGGKQLAGMRGFYDKIVVDYARKLGKKFGAKVSDEKVPAPETVGMEYDGPSLTWQESIDKLNAAKRTDVWRASLDKERDQFDASMRGGRSFKESVQKQSILFARILGGVNTPVDEKNWNTIHALEITPQIVESLDLPLFKIGDKPDPKKALMAALYKARNKPVPAKFEQQSLFDVPQEVVARPTKPKRMVDDAPPGGWTESDRVGAAKVNPYETKRGDILEWRTLDGEIERYEVIEPDKRGMATLRNLATGKNEPWNAHNNEFTPVPRPSETEAVKDPKRDYGTIEHPNITDLSKDFAEDFLGRISYPTITAARNAASYLIAGESGKIESGTQAAKAVDEAIELGVVRRARDIVQGKGSEAEKFDQLIELLGLQPTLSTRTSTSVKDQAYSTPIPLAYVASRLAEIGKSDNVGEPTAGNGALLIEVNPKNGWANEINEDRAANLRSLGFHVLSDDASNFIPGFHDGSVDVVIANPPFGASYDPLQGGVKTYTPDPDNPRYRTNEIDHAISLKALESMKDDGRATLIVGSVKSDTPEGRSDGYNGKSKREFYKTLYDKYNVVDHFTVNGDLYRKQGAQWPVDVIVIHGRGKSSLRLPAADVPRTYNTWEELKGVLNADYRVGATASADVANAEPKPERSESGRRGEGEARPKAGQGDLLQPTERPPELDARPGGRPGASTARPVRGVGSERPRTGDDADTGGSREQSDLFERPDEGASRPAGDTGRTAATSSEGRRSSGLADTERDTGAVDVGTAGASYRSGSGERTDLTSAQAPYRPASKAAGLNTLVPANMRNSIEESLARLMEREGSVDSYVARELDYNPEELSSYFSAEQIDAAALALASIERDEGFIIGDQGGIGKGRVVAAIIKYARLQGRTAIFVTEKPNLYKDIVRDLVDIGEGRISDWARRAVMTNGAQSVPLDDDQTVFLKSPAAKLHNAKLSQMAADEDLHGHEVVFTTYAQMQTLKSEETERRQFLRHFAKDAIIIFDESHNAGGSENKKPKKKDGKELPPDRAQFAREISRLAHGVFYSSATYAKRPSVMDLYSKTDMHKAVESFDKLIDAFTKGGIPLQQVVAAMLAEAGQYIRRERDLSGLTYATHEIKVDKQKAEDMAAVMRRIREFDDLIEDVIEEVKDDLKDAGSTVLADGSVRTPGVNSTNFTAIMHNLIDQMLLMVKADGVVEKALETLKAGEKPVITVSNTMGAFIHQYAQDNDLNTGDAIALNFGDMLKRYLERSREIVIGKAFGDKERVRLTDGQIGSAAVEHFEDTRKQIESMNWEGLHMSPIDYIKNRLAQQGYKIGEITGRGHVIDYSGRKPAYRTRPGREISIAGRIHTLTQFNNGGLDGLIMNQAGSTGLSIHASSKFRDQKPRHMLIAQAEKNIDTHMQLLYRVDRTGQVVKPTYSQIVANIPAENRPAAVLSKKMASLNANTTAARSSAYEAKDMPDFMNDYGDEVAATLMEDNPEMHKILGKPLKESEHHEGFERDGAMRRVTGRIPLLPVVEQEDFYQTLMNEYNDFIQRLDAMGENALEAKTMDLDAKQVASTKIFDSKGSSPFEQGALAEEMDVKRVGKPFTKEQVLTQLRDALEAPDASLVAMEKKGDSEQFKVVIEMRKEFAGYKKEFLQELKTADRRAANDVKLQEIMDKWADIRRTLAVGSSVKLVSAFGINYGIVTKIERKGSPKNPAALGSWRATFAVADAMKQLVMPFSKIVVGDPSSIGETFHSIAVRRVKDAEIFDRKESKWVTVPIIEAFERRQTESREMRTIITGNLLAGFGQFGRGRILNFTDDQGQVRQGIMMPQDFDVRKELQKQAVKFSKAEHVVRFLGEGPANARVVESADKELRINAINGGKYRFTVPAARARGGQYYLNDKLLKAANNEFVKSGNVMQMTVSEPAAKSAVQTLMDSDVTLVTNSHKEEAAKITGVNLVTGKSVSVPKGQAGSVGIGALLGSAGTSAEDARDTFSFIDSLKTRVLQGGSQLRAASKEGYEAFAQAAGTRARAQVVAITAKQQIQRALGGGAEAYDKFLAALTESRLRGVRDRWLEMADAVRNSDDDELKENYPGLRNVLARIFDHPMFDQDNEQLGDLLTYTDSLAAADHWTPLRNFIAAGFELAGDNVASIEWEGENDWFDDYVDTEEFKSALPIYKRLVERPLAESHAENEGVFSNALGPLDTYAPLVPVKDDGSLLRRIARGSFKPYKRPENIHNRMATGLSERYELNAGNLAESVAKAFWTNDKARLLQVLEDEGLIVPLKLGQPYERAIVFRGVHYKADPVSITDPKVIFKDGKVIHVGGKMALVPRFIKRELKPILDGDFSDGSANALVTAINMIGMAGPLDAVFHTNNVIGALVAGTPWAGTDIVSKTLGNTPATKMIAAIVNIIRTDPLDERGLEELQELAKLGILPDRWGSVAFRRKFAREIGAKWRPTFAPVLYGAKGLDARARLLMYRIAKQMNPNASNEELIQFIGQMGVYNRAMQSEIERWLKRWGVSPFYTAGMTMLRNGVRIWTGRNVMPLTGTGSEREIKTATGRTIQLKYVGDNAEGDPQYGIPKGRAAWWNLAQQISGGVLGLLGLWFLLHKLERGKYPWEENDSRLLQIKLNDKHRQKGLVKRIYGEGNSGAYVGLGFLSPMVERGARATGVSGAYETAFQGGTPGQIGERMERDAVNSLSHPFTSGPAFRGGFVFATGDEPYLSQTRDQYGHFGPQLRPAIEKSMPGFDTYKARVREGFFSWNNFNQKIAAEMFGVGHLAEENEKRDDAGGWLRMALDLAVPRLIKGTYNRDKAAARLRKQIDVIEPDIVKQLQSRDVKDAADFYRHADDKLKPTLLPALLRKVQIAAPGTVGEEGYASLKEAGVEHALQAIDQRRPVEKELARLSMKFPQVERTVQVQGLPRRLNDEHYEAYQVRANELFYERLPALFADKNYTSASNTIKEEMIRDTENRARALATAELRSVLQPNDRQTQLELKRAQIQDRVKGANSRLMRLREEQRDKKLQLRYKIGPPL